MTHNDPGWLTMTQDDIPGVMGPPGGPGGRQGAPGGSGLPLVPKRVIKQQNNDPNHGFKYPKCVLTQKGWYLLIYGAFGAIWMHYNSNIKWKRNIVKNRISGKFHTIGSTDHQVQFLNGFSIFHKAKYIHGLWKIAEKPNPLVKFCCGTYCVKV